MAYQTRGRDPLFDSNMQAAIEKRGKELAGLALVALGLMAAAMIGSYTPDDPSWLSATDAPVQNWMGRIGASMAAEIGTMRVTEQVDALTTLSTNPFKYLVAPRVIAGLTMLPLLVVVADIIGVLGGYLVSVFSLGFNAANYMQSTFDFMETLDVVSGLVKAAVFGMIITVMGCYHGYYSQGGAHGVGKATTNAVVSSSILILFFDFILTGIFFATDG